MKTPDGFDTSEELRDYVIRLIRQIGLTPSLKQKDIDAYHFFVALFQRHPEKERKGVAQITDIAIRRFPKANPRIQPLPVADHQIFILKADGTEDSISWNTCVKGEVNPIGKKLTWAMRDAIEGQIQEFKRAHQTTPCELCGIKSLLTVDHIVKFKQLKDDFLVQNPSHPTEFAKNHLAQEVFRQEDISFVEAWQQYHKAHATLRILCRDCNQKIDNYGANHV